MKIALVGGLIRREGELAKIADRAGHQIEWHCGDVGGRGAEGCGRSSSALTWW